MGNFVAETVSASLLFPNGYGESFMKLLSAISPFVVSSALLLSTAWAAEPPAPLPAGKPAGLKQAQLEGGNGMLVVAGAALVGITVGLATAGGDDAAQPGTTTVTSTTGTNP
jgi:hypothetical protein